MNPKARIPAIAAISFLNLLPAADAAPQTWVGLGTNGNWTTPGNFTPGGVDTTSEVIFTGSNYLTNNFKDIGSGSVRSLAFAPGAGAFVLQGGGLGTQFGITNQSSNLQTLSFGQVVVGSTQGWDAGSGGLRITAPVLLDLAGGSVALTVTGSGNTAIGGNISELSGAGSGSGGLIKQGTGTLTLTGSNSYSGSTIVRAGTLAIAGGGSINQPPDFTVAQLPGDTATAVLSNGSATTGFIFIASNIGATGTIQMNGGTWNNTNQTQVGSSGAGTFNLAGGTFFDVSAGIGAFANSVGVANVSGGAWTNSTDIIVGAGGSGTLNISAGTVSSPLLRVAGSAGSTGAINLNGGVLLAGSVTEGDGSGTVSFRGGTLRLRTNQATLFSGFEAGDIILTNGGGTIDSQAFNVATAVGLTGNGGLTKQGSGTLSLTGSNNYTGATDVRAGTLIVNSGSINHTNAAMTVGKSNGDTAALVISNGGRVVSDSGLVGDAAGSTGSVLVRAGTWANLGTLFVGDSGAGSMTINGGGVSNTTGTIGGRAGSTSSVTVTSGGWTNSGNLNIGGGGTGSLLINGGFVGNTNALLGVSPSGVGSATVSSGSWSNRVLSVGYSGSGTLLVEGGTVGGLLVRVGELTNGVGNATVSGGTLRSSGNIVVAERGTGTLNLVGAGTVTANAGDGTVTVAQNAGSTGTLNIGTNGAAGTLNAALVEGGAGAAVLNFNHTNNLTFTSQITGGIQLNKLSSGTTTLTRSNTYSGATAIEAGALLVNGALGGTNTVTVKSGATLGGTGSIAGAVTVENGGLLAPGASAGTLSVGSLILNSTSRLKFELGTSSDLVVVAGDLALDGLLDVTPLTGFGAGSYTLFEYSGSLTDNGLFLGTVPSGFRYQLDLSTTNYVRLTVAPPDLYWDGPNTTPNGTVNGGTGTWNNTSSNWTSVNGLTNYIWNELSTGFFAGTPGTVTVGTNVAAGNLRFETNGYVVTGPGQIAVSSGVLTVNTATNVGAQISAGITGTGELRKTGPGTLVLAGSNSHTGRTVINQGTLAVVAGGVINNTNNDLWIGADSGDVGTLNVSSNAVVSVRDSYIGLDAGSTGTANVTGGVWSNSQGLQVGFNGVGTLNLGGGAVISQEANIGYFGEGTGNVSGGTWSNSGLLVLGVFTNGILNLSGGSLYTSNAEVGYFGVGTANVTGGLWSNTTDIVIGVRNDGALNISNGTVSASVVTVTGALGSNGRLNLAGGTLLSGQVREEMGTGTVTFSGGTLRLTTNQATLFSGFENGDVILTNGGGTIDTDTFDVATALSLTGNGSLTKLGAGTLTLTGSNSYSGGTTITAGTLQLGNGGTNGSITGNVTNNGALAFNRSDAITFSNVISGSGSLAKLGASTLTFTGSNSYTGGTAITAGTLQIGTGGTAGSITGDITNNGALVFNRSDAVTFSNAISGSGSLAKLGASTLTLTGSNSYTGGTAITAGTLQVGTGGTAGSITGDITNNGALVFDRAGQLTFSNVISGSGSLAKLGAGTLALTAANSYAGGTVLSSGTLLVGDDLSLGSGAFQIGGGTTFGVVSGENVGLSNAVTLLGNVDIAVDSVSVLDFEGTVDLGAASRTVRFTEDSSAVCFLGAISGTGGLNLVMGSPGISGDVTFCGPDDNTYTGLTRVGDGLELGLEKDTGAIAIAGDLLVDAGGAVTLFDTSEQINPASTVTVNGIFGILAISGTTTQTIGNLQGGGSIINTLGQAVLNVNSGNFSGTILDGGSAGLLLFKNGPGTLTLGGASAYQGGTFVNEGTLRTTTPTALGTGPVALGGGTLAPTGQLDVASLDWTGGLISSTLGAVTSLVNIAGDLRVAKGGGTFDFTAGAGFTPNTFYNILNAANLDDALMALISGNPLLGLNPVFTRIGTSLLVSFAGSSTGPVLQNIGGPWTPTTANFFVNGPVVTGAPADSNTVNSLVFAPNGQLQVFNNLTVTSGVFDVGSGNAGLAGGSVLVPGSFSKTGAGTLEIGSNFLVQGAANLTGGQMTVNGQFTAPGGFNVFANALLGGSGVINGSLLNNGTVAPGNSPGTLTVTGNYTQSATGTLQLEIASTSLFDRLVVGGTANLAGTLAVQDTGGTLAYGQQYDFLQAAGITGSFDQITMPSPERYRGRVLTNGGTGSLLIAPTSYTLVAATANQRAAAGALDAYIPATSGDRQTVSIALDRLDASQFPAALDQIAPTFHESLAEIAIEQTFAMMQMLNQRMGSTRLGTRSFEASGIESQPLAYDKGGQRTADPKDLKNAVVQEIDPRWSLWTQGSGMFAKVTSANQVPSHGYDGGAVLLGADYTFGDTRLRPGKSALTAGVFGGYQGYYARYDGGGRTTANSAVFGAYASLTKGGFYVDSVVSGGYGNFKVLRPIDFSTIDRTARSSQDSGQFSASVNLGHDWQAGNFTFGPVAGAQYTYVGIAPFTERGADSLNLRLDQQDANSLRSTLGGRLAYTWKVSDKVAIIPEGRMFWVHEFLNDARSMDAALDSGAGPTFGYMTSDPTRDSVFCGAGVTAQFGESLTTSAYWNVDFGRTDFTAQFLSLNVGWKF